MNFPVRPLSLLALHSSLLFSSGCAYLGSARSFDPARPEPGLVLLKPIEPVRQRVENDCGPAAVTMAMRLWGDAITLDEALAALPPREGGGVTAGAIRDFARGRGWSAWLFQGTLEDIEHQLAKGRPLIVGLMKSYIDKIRPHFEVVVGIHPAQKYVVTLDPANGWQRNGFEGFLREWEGAGRTAILVSKN